MVSHLEVYLQKKTKFTNNIGEALIGNQIKLRKEYLFVQYEKNVKLLLDTIIIKYLPDVTKVLCSIIDTSIREGKCSDALNCVTRH